MSDKPDKLITPRARVAFAPQLFTPRAGQDGGVEKYGASFLFDAEAQKTPEYAALRNAIVAIGRAERKHWDGTQFDKLVAAGKVRVPLLKGDDNTDKNGNVYDGFAGTMYIRPTSKLRPQIIDRDKTPITEMTELYSGCYARASLGIFTYEAKGNRGIAFGLRNVQKLGDGPPLGSYSRAEDDFEPVAADASSDIGFKAEDDLPF